MEEEDGADWEAGNAEERVLLEDMRERPMCIGRKAGETQGEMCIQCPGTVSVSDQCG